jgi:signal transduction histidine kinase
MSRLSMPSHANDGVNALLAYVSDLELEVDHLRKQAQVTQTEARSTLKRIQLLCADAAGTVNRLPPLPEIEHAVVELSALLRDVHEPPADHLSRDQVIAIAVRPVLEKLFRWQQRQHGAAEVVLRMELESEHLEWFPARFRHIVDNLLSNSLRYRDRTKSESWVRIGLRTSPHYYELQICDNGIVMPTDGHRPFDAGAGMAPVRASGLGVGLSVVKLLVEQSGGRVNIDSGEGQGTTLAVVLPRYDVDDYLGRDAALRALGNQPLQLSRSRQP